MDSEEQSGERLYVTVTNQGPVRRHVAVVLVLDTDDNFSVLANRVDPQGVAALLDRSRERFSHRRGERISQTSADDVEVVDAEAPALGARKPPPEAAVATSSNVQPLKLVTYLTPPKTNDSPGVAGKMSSRGVTLVTELARLYKAGSFQGDANDLNKTMFFDPNHPRYARVPDDFSEKSLYKYAMQVLAMGITTKHLIALNNSTLDDTSLWKLIHVVVADVMGKKSTLEKVYGVRGRDDPDKSGLSITGLGRQFKKLKDAMVKQLGKNGADQQIDQHMGVYGMEGELQQQNLQKYFK